MQHNSFRSYYRPYPAENNLPRITSYNPRNPSSGPGPYYDPGDYLGGPNYMDLNNGSNYFPTNNNSNNYINMSSNSNANNIRIPPARFIPANHSNNQPIRPISNNIPVSVNSNNAYKPNSSVVSVAVSSPLETCTDVARLPVLKAVMQRTQSQYKRYGDQRREIEVEEQRLLDLLQKQREEKRKVVAEEQRLRDCIQSQRAEIDRIEGRVRDPRLKTRPQSSNSNSQSSLPISSTSSSHTTSTGSTITVSLTNSTASPCSYSNNSFTNSVSSALGLLLTTNQSQSYSQPSSTTTTPVITSPALIPPPLPASSQQSLQSASVSSISITSATFGNQNVYHPSSVTISYQPQLPRYIPSLSSSDTTTTVSSTSQLSSHLLHPISSSNNNQVSTSTSNSVSLTSSSPSLENRNVFSTTSIARKSIQGNNSISPSYLANLLVNKQGSIKVNNQHCPSKGKQLSNLVQFKPLPLIYDCFAEDIVEPKSYNDVRKKLCCVLKQSQVNSIVQTNNGKRILLRICIIKTKKTSQSDRVPRKLQIKINGRIVSSSKNTTGSIKAPLDVTAFFVLNYQTVQEIELTWPDNEPIKDYGVGVFLTHRLPVEQTLALLQTKDYLRPSAETLELIEQKYANTSDICSEDITISLLCPITKHRIEYPCIGTKCEHLVCFDAKSFLNIYRQRSEWHCPTCKKVIGYNDLRLDGFMQEVLANASSDCLRITIDQKGVWKSLNEHKHEGSDCPTVIDVSYWLLLRAYFFSY